jgi:hypothetical protein
VLAVKGGDVEIVKRLVQDPKPISDLKIPALLAKTSNNHAMEKLIKDEIERKNHGSHQSQDQPRTKHVRFAYY